MSIQNQTESKENKPPAIGVLPPTTVEAGIRFTKGWLSPDGRFHPLQGLIHDWWSALALGEEFDVTNPTSKHTQILFSLGWVRVRPEGGGVLKFHNEVFAELNAAQQAALKQFQQEQPTIRTIHEHKFRVQILERMTETRGRRIQIGNLKPET